MSSRHNFQTKWLSLCIASIVSSHATAGVLDIAEHALEISIGAEPNIVILLDDSGSMDWEVMTTDQTNGGLFTGQQRDGTNTGVGPVKHRDSNDDGTADCNFSSGTFFGYTYSVEFGSNTYSDDGNDCNTADDQSWRFRNSNFNALYFDPTREYKPWPGVDSNGDPLTNIDITNAPDNPYNPAEYIDLTQHNSNWDGGTDRDTSDRNGDGQPDGFRYYTWTDSNSNGLFDNGEQTEFYIKNADAATKQNFANWFSYYRSRDLVAKGALGFVIDELSNARVGFATINDSNNSIEVASMNASSSSGNKKALLDKIYGSPVPALGTPIRQNLELVGKYFECLSGNIFDADGSYTCPLLAAPIGTCQQNYALLMTDGFYNGSDPSVGNADANTTNAFDGGAFADSASNTLADVAMHYYKRDLSTTLDNNVPATTNDADRSTLSEGDSMHQRMNLYTVSFGVTGSISSMPTDFTTPFTWPATDTNEGIVDDLLHAAYNGRGEYFSAGDPEKLASGLSEVFKKIQAESGAASAVAFNTQNIESNTLLFRAFYNPRYDNGDVVAQKINTDGSISDLITWSAASKLDEKIAADGRVIITYDKANATGVAFNYDSGLTTAQKTALESPAPTSLPSGYGDGDSVIGDERVSYLRGSQTLEGENFDTGQFRERFSDSGRLGDIIHSTPTFVGPPSFIRRDSEPYPTATGSLYSEFAEGKVTRTEMVYVGANDGMLHGLNANTGEEVFAYIPDILFDKLGELTNPNYVHQMYVDEKVSVNDAFTAVTDGGAPAWASVLVGALGAGGEGYFALNITEPSNFSTETSASNQVMWEFTNADDSDLGLSFSRPIIAMTNTEYASGEKRWAAIFGNGYNSTSTDGDAALYVVFLDGGLDGVWTAGTDYIKISTGKGKVESSDGTTPNGLGIPRAIDLDSNGTVDYIYVGDLQGNLYRFDLTSTATTDWSDSASQQILFTATYSDSSIQPLIGQPIAVRNPNGTGLIVIAGTGSWFLNSDVSSTAIQSLYGIWDTLKPSTTYPVPRSDLVEQSFTNIAGTVEGTVVRTLTDNLVTYKETGTKVMGWYIDFDVLTAGSTTDIEFPGERPVRQLLIRDGILFTNTVIPSTNLYCTSGPGGFQIAISPVSGGVGRLTPIFDINSDGSFDAEDNVPVTDTVVSGTRFEGATPSDSSFIGDFLVTQLSDKSIEIIKTDTSDSATGRLSWRQIFLE
ncbi:pilus assembly protein [Zooshikella sp. RANM57]|uniref:pilus assembly protein n=1 Tax=Zooshikella sp. RANM57 TaxID=3425863 RepID=UPI003D6E09D2